MVPKTPQPGGIQSQPSRLMDDSFNAHLAEIQQQRRHQFVHCDAAIASTEHMAQDGHLKKVCKTEHRNNRQHHAIGCELLHMYVEGGQLTG